MPNHVRARILIYSVIRKIRPEALSNLKIVVIEYFRSGGIAGIPLSQVPASLLEEGTAMLRALVEDCTHLPNVEVSCLLDPRIHDDLSTLPYANPCEAEETWEQAWPRLAKGADLCVLIAPEQDHCLIKAVQWMRDAGIPVLAGDPTFLQVTSDKLACYQAWASQGILTPPTFSAGDAASLQSNALVADFACPTDGWILKPRMGAGCEEVQLIGSLDRLRSICQRLESPDHWIFQPRVVGEPGSVSVLAGECLTIMPPMKQTIEHLLGFSQYLGGAGPWREVAAHWDSTRVAQWIEAIPGKVAGWLGIDFIMPATGQPVAIEINPRLTTSYLGLRQLCVNNLAHGMVQAFRERVWRPRWGACEVEFSSNGEVSVWKTPAVRRFSTSVQVNYTDSGSHARVAESNHYESAYQHQEKAAVGVRTMKKRHRFSAKKFRVPEGEKIRLHKIPTVAGSELDEKEEVAEALAADVSQLQEMQQVLFASGSHSLLIILQGMDASGKDGLVRHVMSGINPQGCRVTGFKAPNSDDLQHHFLWRPMRYLPERGMIGIFNRSYYEEVLVVRVHQEFLKSQRLPKFKKIGDLWEQRFEEIRNFEETLYRHGTHVLKFFLHISQEEQRARMLERLKDPTKHWKFNERDLVERGLWQDYQAAYNEALPATSTKHSPWYVVPADNKWYCRAVVADLIAQRVEELNLAYPQVPAELQGKFEGLIRQLENEGATSVDPA